MRLGHEKARRRDLGLAARHMGSRPRKSLTHSQRRQLFYQRQAAFFQSISPRPEVLGSVKSNTETRTIPAGIPGPTRQGMGNPSPRKHI